MANVLLDENVHDLKALQTLAERLAARFKIGDWIWLEGELGAGKTTLVQAILRAYDYEGEVRSPTYGLVNEYEHSAWGKKIIHIDGYRLSEGRSQELPWDPKDWESSLLFAEWPQATGLPKHRFQYKIQIERLDDSDARSIRLISQPFL